MSAYLSVISTRFPGVNHRLPVQHKQVNQTQTGKSNTNILTYTEALSIFIKLELYNLL